MPAVKIRKKNSSTAGDWDTLYPQTTVDQIKLNTSGDALSTFTENILKVSNTDTADPGANSFVQTSTAGALDFLTGSQLRIAIGAAPTVHTHTFEQILDGATELPDVLADKADLNTSGVIPASQIPDYLFGGLKYAGTALINASTDTLEELLSAIDLNLSLGASPTSNQRKGAYFVALPVGGEVLEFGSSHILIAGDEGDTTSSVELEAGDWIVYIGYNTSTSKHEWAIINNTYRNAGTGNVLGVVALSAGTATTRAALSSTGPSELRVMDEKAVRTVMKDIFYGGTPSGETGDLWFEGTF